MSGHPGYTEILHELASLHILKSGGYGTTDDPFENFSAIARAKGQPRFVYPLDRDYEKSTRCYSLLKQGRVEDLEEEFLDKASLMICSAAMLREDQP